MKRYRVIWSVQTNEFVVPELMAKPIGSNEASFVDFDDLDEARAFQKGIRALSDRYGQIYGMSKFIVNNGPLIIDRLGE
jgi:hypothetical protein